MPAKSFGQIVFLLQWPTLITLVMLPTLVAMYVRLARREEREALVQVGEVQARYAAIPPALVPRIGRPRQRTGVPDLKGDAS